MAYGLSNGHVTDDVTWPWKVKLVTPICLERNISKTILALDTSNLVCSFVLGMPNMRTNNFPESGRGLGHVTPTIFGSTVGYPSDSLASCQFVMRSIWPRLIIVGFRVDLTKFSENHYIRPWFLSVFASCMKFRVNWTIRCRFLE